MDTEIYQGSLWAEEDLCNVTGVREGYLKADRGEGTSQLHAHVGTARLEL